MKKKRYAFFLQAALLLFPGLLCAQHFQFTQFYAAPLHLNPAFTGQNVCSRVSTIYRDQWPSIPGMFVTYAICYDTYLQQYNSGIGFMAMTDRAGSGKLRSTSLNLFYAYELTLTRKWMARAGFQATTSFRSVDFSSLLFGDQIARGGAPTSVEAPTENSAYFDISTGVLFYSRKYWAGFSAHHLTTPNQSLMNDESPLPTEFSVHAGALIPLGDEDAKNEKSISPAVHYRAQSKFDQLDLGFYYTNEPLVLGLWYRGIPLFKAYQPGYANNDAFAALIGLSVDRVHIGYSYDMTISRLTNNTGGSHEVSFSYQFCKLKKKKRKPILISCPKF